MDDKRLDGIGVALGVTSGPTIAHELYEEVRRLRAEQIELRDAVRLEREAFDKRGARVTQQRAELAAAWKERDAATTRTETAERELARQRKANRDVAKQCMDAMERATTAERELAELRERIGEAKVKWYVRWPTAGGDYHYELCLDEADARESVPDDDEACEVVSRVVGEWKVASE